VIGYLLITLAVWLNNGNVVGHINEVTLGPVSAWMGDIYGQVSHLDM